MKFYERVRAMNALDDYLCNMSKVMKYNSVISLLATADKTKINFAIMEGQSLIDNDGNQHKETCVCGLLEGA